MKVVVLVALVALVAALPPTPEQALVDQALVQDVPAVVRKPDPPKVDDDGIVVEDVVNVHKKAIILVMSSATAEGAAQRQLIRDTWMQPLNRSSSWAVPPMDRRSVSVWFVVPRNLDNPFVMLPIEHEGKVNGDMLVVNPVEGYTSVDNMDSIGALTRWLRVAYFERYDFAIFTDDKAFVSVYNLLDFCNANAGRGLFYSGFVNSFERAPASYNSKYYVPFVEKGTVVMSYAVAEIIARELPYVRHVGRWDATVGHFLLPYDGCQPTHSNQFVQDLTNVYSPIVAPIIIKDVTPEQMRLFSTPVLKDGKWVTPVLPAQTEEIHTTHVFVNPRYKEEQPECNMLAADSKCNMAALKALDGEALMNAH